jgi:hypothetical protein
MFFYDLPLLRFRGTIMHSLLYHCLHLDLLHSQPSSSVTTAWLWLLPIALATFISIAFLIYHGNYGDSSDTWDWYNVSRLEQATQGLIRSLASSGHSSL